MKVFDGATGATVRDFSPFGSGMTAGVRVATMFADDDPYADVAVGTGPGVAGEVRVFSGLTSALLPTPIGAYVPFGGSLGGLSVGASNDPIDAYPTASAAPDAIPVGGVSFLRCGLIGMIGDFGTLIPTGTVSLSATNTATSITYEFPTDAVETVDPVAATAEAVWENTRDLPAGTYTLTMDYSGDANFLPGSDTTTLTVGTSSGPTSQVPADGLAVTGGSGGAMSAGACDVVSPIQDAAMAWRKPPGLVSPAGVRYGAGSVTVARRDLASAGLGTPWGQAWAWSSAGGGGDGLSGEGATMGDVPHLVQVMGDTSVAAVAGAQAAHFFDEYKGAYHARHGQAANLAHDTGTDEYVLTDGAGSVFTFYDFSVGTPAGREGRLKSVADPAGNLTEVTGWDADGGPAEVQRVVGSGSTAETESFVYAYLTSGANDGRVASVTQRVRVGTGSWATVRSAEYTYHANGDSHGRTGDLKTAVVKDAAGAVIDTTYYRWYTAAGSGGGTGGTHLLKYAFGPAAYGRLTGALGTGVDSLTDAQVDDYADLSLAYDSADRVATAVASGDGCSACTGGLGTYSYTYTASTSTTLLSPNRWAAKTVETLPDGNTNTVYTNAAGQVMLRVYEDDATGDKWRWFYRYDGLGRVVLAADPSAVTNHSESYDDLVGYSGSTAAYLDDTAGLVTAYTYATATTATTSPGDVSGYLKQVALRQGEAGTAVPQHVQTYVKRTVGTIDEFFPAGSTVYRNDDGTGGQTTTVSYTWQSTTAQPDQVTVTYPAVTTGQNGSGSAIAEVTAFDDRGRAVWHKDAGGFLTHVAYDPITGAVVKSIADVDTTQTSDFTGLPSGWTTPSGGGLHLVTTYEVDDLGRATKATDPTGRIDYTVYKDTAHEVRSYPGWDATANRPTGPTVVVRDDRAGNYAEMFTMSAAPAVTSGRPTGAESVGSLQALSREYRNAAGQVIHRDAYFDLGGLAYTTGTSLGAEGTNFYRTEHAYDQRGRPSKTVSGQDTIYRTEYDGLNRVVSEWVGTDDTPTTGFWSVANTAGTDMTKVREYEYDGGGVGDGNLTEVTEYPGGGAAARVAQAFHDWRGRPVAVKAGVEGSEDAAVNRPITYADYDNLGQVTKTRVYDGDGVTVTSTGGVPNAPSGSLLRAQTTASYDELGRAYRTELYSVDPSSGSVGSYTLKSDTWYDSRGQVVKTVAPGGLVQKAAYDGAGRVTATYLTDGGGDSGYADADDVTGDAVLEQAESTYDAAGRVLASVARQRFHDEADTGALGTPSTGVNARVSYLGYYYDAGGRTTAVVDVGTNGGSAWTRPSSVPARSDTVLVTSADYAADAVQTVRLTGAPTGGTFTLTFGGQTTSGIAHNASAATVDAALEALSSVGSGNVAVTAAVGGGWQVRFAGSLAGAWQARLTASGAGLTGGTSPAVAVATVSLGGDAGPAAAVTDPKGLVARVYADALGRTVQTVENFVDGAVSDPDDKTTVYAYNAAGVTSLTAALTGGGGQTTQWVYGVGSGSGVYSNDVVGATRWPDPTTGAASGSEQESVTVNSLGQVTTSTDRNGTVHTYSYDVLGRIVLDAVTTLGSGVDGAVRRVEATYDGQGNAYQVTSYDAASGGSVVNQVQRAFNGLGQLTAEYQAHSGAVNTSTTPKVQYAYSEMPSGANHSRLTSITYPSGYVLPSNYSSGLNGSISRLSSLSDATGTVEAYSYLGLGTVVVRSHPQPEIDLTYVKQGVEANGDAGDQYAGLDRFGRVVDQRWIDTGSGAATDRFQYGYDRNGNRTYRDNLVNTAFGELYAYDGLNQLVSFDRGTLNGTKTGITGAVARSQDWDYDALGNWDSLTTDGGSPQTRTANAQNEITSVSGATPPTYDANGNMTGDQAGKTLVYDARNRLVAVKTGSTTLETFAYDGLTRRIANTVGSTTTDLYYSAGWQVVEEKAGSNTTTRYVWSPVYVDALVLRDRDTDANGTLDERLWVQQDSNYNVTALVNDSGTVVERYAYDPFGAATVYDASYSVLGGSAYAWVYTFQGLRADPVTGNLHARHRDYSPTLGRWTSVDPIRYAAGDTNLYRFVGNRAVNRVDPSGLADPDMVQSYVDELLRMMATAASAADCHSKLKAAAAVLYNRDILPYTLNGDGYDVTASVIQDVLNEAAAIALASCLARVAVPPPPQAPPLSVTVLPNPSPVPLGGGVIVPEMTPPLGGGPTVAPWPIPMGGLGGGGVSAMTPPVGGGNLSDLLPDISIRPEDVSNGIFIGGSVVLLGLGAAAVWSGPAAPAVLLIGAIVVLATTPANV